MTDTGQVPGEGLPEAAGMVEQPGIPAPGAYTFLDPSGSAAESAGEDDDLLLMPGSQGAWSESQPVAPVPPAQVQVQVQAPAPVPAPAPVSVPVQGLPAEGAPMGAAPGAAEAAVQAAVQQAAVQVQVQVEMPGPAAAPVHAVAPVPEPVVPVVPTEGMAPVMPEPVFQEAPVAQEELPVVQDAPVAQEQSALAQLVQAEQLEQPVQPVHEAEAHEADGRDSGAIDLGGVRMPPPMSTATPPPARRPLHMGPPVPEAGAGVVRSLADRGPAGQQAPVPTPTPGLPTTGPEYLDVPREPQLVEAQPQGAAPWSPEPQPVPAEPVVVAAETVVPAPEPTPVAEFVPVEGSLPTAPHLAPSPVAVMVAPNEEPEAVAVVPAPRDGGAQEEPTGEPEMLDELVAQEPEAPADTAAETAPEPEAVAGPEPEAVTAPEPDTEPQPEAVIAPEAEPQPQPQSEPEAEAATASEPEPEPEAATAPEPETVVTPEPEAAVTPEPEAATAPEPEAVVTPEPEAELTSPEAEAEPTSPEAEAEPTSPEATSPEAEPASPEAPAVADPADIGNTPVDAPVSAPAPGYDDAEREAVLRVMRERRDIRNGFRSDPIPHEVLLRVLEAAHTAPSVGHSQPWDFVVIRSAETRRSMHELAQRQREAYAKSLPKGRAKQFKELKIEAILDTPVNIVVTADPTRGGRHTLGRHTQPQMAPYSSALAVENLWLAARAEGLGVGWVSFFDEREMVRALGLPEHLEVVAYLCVGYVDEFPEEPELMQAGWSKRRPLSWVVHEETYGRRALPGEEPHDLLQETVSNIRPLDAKALGEAWERQKRMTKPAGALGMLEIISAQLAGLSRMCPPPIPEPAAVAIFAGDHGVHAQGVTAWPQEVTGQMVANFLGGGAVCNAFANQVGAEVCVIDVGVASDLPATPGLLPRKVRPGTADFTTGPALTREEVLSAIEVGIETARDLVAAGNKALLTGEMGIANTTTSAALICVYTDVDAAEVTGRGTGINDEMHARKVDVVRRALDLHRPDPADPVGVLAAVGGLEHAALVGFILGGASLRTPVVLDGVSAGAAALVARAVAPEALAACIAGHRSAEPGHVAALNKLGLRPLVDLDLRLGEGTGALLALPVIQSAARAMHEVATFDSAGVTEK
ncbi:nicotinate-nucleotide--dimethylbenzimidazole phosphoribosyltransferase [Streptomyces sp. NPDC000410]|uniref:nicotinate-nucleotide--dimethylbenzimidazole phosphoribosyltransferase n=1 Tax=Streptomyces sp. NPDC000410 TaxID=3154254 RepID=UPI003318303B